MFLGSDKDDLEPSDIPLSPRGRSNSSIRNLKGLELRRHSPLEKRSKSVTEHRKGQSDISASNLSSFMKLDNVQYMTLNKLRKNDAKNDKTDVLYGSPSVTTKKGRTSVHSSKYKI